MHKNIGDTMYAIVNYKIFEVELLERKETIDKAHNNVVKYLVKKTNGKEIFVDSQYLYRNLDRAKARRNKIAKNKINYSLIVILLKQLCFSLVKRFCKLQYVILDCEFNYNNSEIIQMGLIKLTSKFEVVDTLNIFIKPIKPNAKFSYNKRKTRSKIVEQSNKSNISFPRAINLINKWLGENYKTILCTWSCTDIYMLNNNMILHKTNKNELNYYKYLDIQKIFDEKRMNNFSPKLKLEEILKREKIEVSKPLHNALTDAKYTVQLFQNVNKQSLQIAQHLA